MSLLAYVFPGQGTQRVGMGASLRAMSPAAAAVYEEASDLAGVDLVKLCSTSTEDELTDTRRAQIAIYTTNAAALAVVGEVLGPPDAVAGHSVGEWSAFHASGAVSFADGFAAVAERARIMAECAARGGMVAVAGLEADEVAALCADLGAGTVQVAVENAPRLVVCAGDQAAVEALGARARERGAVRVTPVRTSHPFHSVLMAPATPVWGRVVAEVALAAPRCPVALNHTGRLSTDPEALRIGAVLQIEERVRWRGCLESLAGAGVTDLVEVGDSKTLAAFARATVPTVRTVALGAPHALRRLHAIERTPDAVP